VGSSELILLDTHALLWLDLDDPALGPTARKRTDTALQQGCLTISAISFWEVAMLASKGRIVMEMLPASWRRDLLSSGLTELPVDGEMGILATSLGDFHSDPADRLILATAIVKRATLITADEPILGWPHKLERLDARV
ncbi:MAG: type II toxin-antitoxin system VapC family toxin, partial [Gammaproteobacteria bacterium]